MAHAIEQIRRLGGDEAVGRGSRNRIGRVAHPGHGSGGRPASVPGTVAGASGLDGATVEPAPHREADVRG